MRDLFSLEGKIALVTGGSVGIGAMIAEGFVNFGAKVYIVARREKALKKKQEELAKIGPCEYIVADVSSVRRMHSLLNALLVLLNNHPHPFRAVKVGYTLYRGQAPLPKAGGYKFCKKGKIWGLTARMVLYTILI
jgi:hypothetical protein